MASLFSLHQLIELPSFDQLGSTLMISTLRVLVESSATLLIGILVAANIRVAGGYPAFSKWLDEPGTIRRTLQIVLVSACLPLCALGVIPIAIELSKSGMPKRDLVAFWLAAPLFNPISILYAICILPLAQCACLLFASLSLVLLVTEIAGRFVDDVEPTEREIPTKQVGTDRLWNILVAAGSIATGPILLFVGISILVNGLVLSLIAPGAFERIASYQNLAGTLEGSLLTVLQIVSPITFVMAASAIHHAHLSFSAAIVIRLLGVTWNTATLLAMRAYLGLGRTLALGIVTAIFTVVVSVAAHSVFVPAVGDEEETHGMDTLARPYHASSREFSMALSQQLTHTDILMQAGSVLLSSLLGWGCFVRYGKLSYRHSTVPKVETSDIKRGFDFDLTPGQIGIAGVCILAAVLFGMMYVVFPGASESFDEMQKLQADAVVAINTGDHDLAVQKLAEWDAVAAKLPVGWMLRLSIPDDKQATEIRNLRTALWETRSYIATPTANRSQSKQFGLELIDKFHACRLACVGEKK